MPFTAVPWLPGLSTLQLHVNKCGMAGGPRLFPAISQTVDVFAENIPQSYTGRGIWLLLPPHTCKSQQSCAGWHMQAGNAPTEAEEFSCPGLLFGAFTAFGVSALKWILASLGGKGTCGVCHRETLSGRTSRQSSISVGYPSSGSSILPGS